MIARTSLRLPVVVLLGVWMEACAPAAPPVPTVHGYRVSLEVSEPHLWLGPQNLGDPRPNTAALLVEVGDSQGQPVDGIPVEFTVAPSWADSVRLTSPRTLTQAGKARATLEPLTTGVIPVMAQVDGQTYSARISVEARNFRGSGSP